MVKAVEVNERKKMSEPSKRARTEISLEDDNSILESASHYEEVPYDSEASYSIADGYALSDSSSIHHPSSYQDNKEAATIAVSDEQNIVFQTAPPEVHARIAQAESDLLTESLIEESASILHTPSCFLEQDKEYEIEDDSIPFNFDLLNDDPPLYHGAPITLHQSLVSILTLVLTFQLSGVCLKSLLDLIQLHLPAGNKFRTSLQFFKDYFFYLQSPKQFEYYCSQCYSQFSKGSSCPKECLQSKTCYLIKIPIGDQLKTLFAREGFISKLNFEHNQTPGRYTDLYDGNVYQEQVKNGSLGKPCHLSFQWYTDGVALYTSTNFSVWLTYLTVNELPYNLRYKKENVIVPVIWCGSTKPPSNLILNSIQPELKELSGGKLFDINGAGSKIVECVVLNGTADLPAKAMMLNMKESNGASSCHKCEQEGESRANLPGVRLFPYNPAHMTPRTNESFMQNADAAFRTGKAVKGVKGPSTLSKIVPDVMGGMAIDPMHLLAGVTKKILSSLLCTKPTSKKFSISSHLDTLDRRLLSIKPPAHIMRLPRSLKELAYWKMSELLHWLTEYAVPVLQKILPQRQFLHFCSLVAAVQLLSSDIVSEADILKAKDLLNVFVSQIADFYSYNILTMNFHLLLHLPEVVRDLGPMWVYTCFPLENLNGIVLNLVHGTRWADRQIATSVQTCLGLPNIVEKMKDSPSKNFCVKVLTRRKFITSDVVDNCLIESETMSTIPEHIQVFLHEEDIQLTKASEFKSLKKGKFIYISQKNNLSARQDSTVAAFRDQDTLNVGIVQQFLRCYICDCSDSCLCTSKIYVVVKVAKKIAGFPTLLSEVDVPNTHQYDLTNELKILPCSDLLAACILIKINNENYISLPINSKERE